MANEPFNPEDSEESMNQSAGFRAESPNGKDGAFDDISFDDLFDDDEAPVDDLFETKEEPVEREMTELEKELAVLDQFEAPEMDFSSTVDIFTNISEDELTEEQSALNEAETKKKPPIVMVVGIAIAALLLAVIVALVVSILGYQARQRKAAEPIPIQVLAKPSDLPNDLNYIFVNDAKELGDQLFHIKKLMIDPFATVFYFSGDIDLMDYNFVLYDSTGKAHAMDLIHMFDSLTVPAEKDPYTQETIVRFEPFSTFPPSIVLEVTDIYTEERITFTYNMTTSADSSGARYLSEPIHVPTNVDNVELTLEHAIFSGSGSMIGYKIHWNDANGERIQFGNGDTPDAIKLKENGVTIYPKRSAPLEFTAEDSIIGRMDFNAVQSLDSTVDISFGNAFVNLKRNETISLAPLFLNSLDSEVYIDLGEYRVVLERFALQGSFYVLVLHAIDKNIPVSGPEDYSNRVQVELEATLHVAARDGMDVDLEGRSGVSPVGTDMLFGTSGMSSYLNTLPPESFTLQISGIGIEMKDISATLDLSQLDTRLKPEHNAVLSRIKMAFHSRLAYKSGKLWRDNMIGFSKNVLLDEALMRNYQPLDNLIKDPFYSAQVLTYTFESERILFAIVLETWQGITDEAEIHFYRKHQIKAERIGEEWMIVENILID